jgi:hypothetical protein
MGFTFMKSVKHYWKWLKDGRLFFLFIGWPAVVFGIAYLIFGYKVQAWHTIAYAMQLGAFTIFIIRLNKLYEHYDPNGKGYIGAIIRWLKRFLKPKTITMGVGALNDSQGVVSAIATTKLPEGASNKEIIEWVERQFEMIHGEIKETKKSLNKKINHLETTLTDRINNIEGRLQVKQDSERKLQLPNLGNELVAVLWLISAVAIFAITGLNG